MMKRMEARRIIVVGILAGLTMGLALFIFGAILARIIYGPQMAPPGKFEPDQLNPFYFIWTKLLIGVFFGILLTFIYERLPLSRHIKGPAQGIKYAFILWLAISLWDLSHPLVYGPINYTDQLFWLLYTLFGFLSLGYVLGFKYRRIERTSATD